MDSAHSNAIVTASTGTDEKAVSPPVSQTAGFRIDVADENSFSLGKLGAIRHNYHLHPLMQMDRLAQLAKSLVQQNSVVLSPAIRRYLQSFIMERRVRMGAASKSRQPGRL